MLADHPVEFSITREGRGDLRTHHALRGARKARSAAAIAAAVAAADAAAAAATATDAAASVPLSLTIAGLDRLHAAAVTPAEAAARAQVVSR